MEKLENELNQKIGTREKNNLQSRSQWRSIEGEVIAEKRKMRREKSRGKKKGQKKRVFQ